MTRNNFPVISFSFSRNRINTFAFFPFGNLFIRDRRVNGRAVICNQSIYIRYFLLLLTWWWWWWVEWWVAWVLCVSTVSECLWCLEWWCCDGCWWWCWWLSRFIWWCTLPPTWTWCGKVDVCGAECPWWPGWWPLWDSIKLKWETALKLHSDFLWTKERNIDDSEFSRPKNS